MDFKLSSTEEAFRDGLRAWLEAHCLAALESPVNQIYERFIVHSDPNNERTAVVQSSDVGLDKGGWGKILMKVSVERVK